MTPEQIEQMRADMAAGMPTLGGWRWFGNRDSIYLATRQGGRRFIMDFVRKGMRSAQPRFQTGGCMFGALDSLTQYEVGDGTARGQAQANADPGVYRLDVSGIDHPDARRIARVPDLEAEVLRAREAADDLLAALEACRIVLAEHEPHPLPVLAQVLAAIAKARK